MLGEARVCSAVASNPHQSDPDMTDALPTGEAALWRAVVLQALQDATLGMHNPTSRKPRKP